MAQEGGIGIIQKSMGVAEQAEQVRKVKKFESGVVKDPITIQQTVTATEAVSNITPSTPTVINATGGAACADCSMKSGSSCVSAPRSPRSARREVGSRV